VVIGNGTQIKLPRAIEIKLGHKIKKGMLTASKNFLKDTDGSLGILVNNSDKIEFLADNIMQIPACYF